MQFASDFNPTDFKILLKKNGGGVVASYTSVYKGHQYFHIRILFEDADGNWRPTREGISVPIGDKEALVRAIASSPDLIVLKNAR